MTGQHELVGALGQLEQALRGAAGDVEEHAVGERLVHRPQSLREQSGDAPQQIGLLAEQVEHGLERDRQHGRRLERTRHRRARPLVEHRHLAEQIAGLHQRHHGLAVVDRVGDRDGEPAADHDVERVGGVALAEQDVATDQVPLVPGAGDRAEHVR